MVLSTFSHYSILHLGVNMYVLQSFVSRKFLVVKLDPTFI